MHRLVCCEFRGVKCRFSADLVPPYHNSLPFRRDRKIATGTALAAMSALLAALVRSG